MAITTLAGAVSGLQQPISWVKAAAGGSTSWTTYWNKGGFPAAGSYNATLNGVTLSQTGGLVTGAFPFFDPPSGNAYLAKFGASSQVNGPTASYMLCDRIWHNGGFTITIATSQTIVSPAWPARDMAGSTNGAGVLLALEVSAACGAATPSVTVGYTNSAGTSGRTATNFETTISGSAISSMYTFNLQAGDVGVRSVQSLTLGVSWVSGTINLVAYRPLLMLDQTNVSGLYPVYSMGINSGFPRLYNGTVPYLVTAGIAGSAGLAAGTFQTTQG